MLFKHTRNKSKKQPQTKLPMSIAMSDFNAFLNSELGDALIASERSQLADILSGLYGYNCLQLSVQKSASLYQSMSIGHLIKMGYAPNVSSEDDDSLWASYESFPVANDCVDLALLHHVLEFASEPHQLIREADRTLTAGGHLIVLGFNPFSIWPIYQRYLSLRQLPEQCSGYGLRQGTFKTISQSRLADWLALLNYDVLHQQSYFYRPPVNSKKWLDRFAVCEKLGSHLHLPTGLVYITLARKKTVACNPLFLDWRKALRPAQLPGMHSRLGDVELLPEATNTAKTIH